MNNLERRLVELNDALMKLNSGEEISPNILETACKILAGTTIEINTGSGNDTVVINSSTDECNDLASPDSITEDRCKLSTILVDSSYYAENKDCYIGVNSSEPTTVYLPKEPPDGKIIIVKAEMGPPLGNRKVKIATNDNSLIDGDNALYLTVKYESKTFVYRDGQWHTIGGIK